MKEGNRHIKMKWFLLVLFTSYVSAISLFTHTHVVDKVTYVHSHPFKVGEETQHTHSVSQLLYLDTLFHTQLTSDIIPEFDLTDKSTVSREIDIRFLENTYLSGTHRYKSLRAPPAA